MKTIYSLNEFQKAVKEIAATKGITYTSVNAELNTDGVAEFGCYVADYGWHTAQTIEGSLLKLKSAMSINVTSDLEILTEQ